ncbi:MAG: type II toxin-antitoxin system HicB family antitoxin [Chloroflexota bacterium]|nr:type II toxin-antitoxin system HicB family antitoxin [Chloroflexota bacterium]
MMTYKGYSSHVEFDDEADILHGRVIDIQDVITFQGETVAEIHQAFHDSVDDYLEFCQELGREPEKPLSEHLIFRTSPERHRRIYLAAKKAGESINSWMDNVLSEAADEALRLFDASMEERQDAVAMTEERQVKAG